MEVYANCPERLGPEGIAERARRAEAMGYDGIQVPDAVHDGLLLAAMALAATERLKVITGVLLAFPRSPMVTAIAAWDLQRMSQGRFELGLGTQVQANIEQRYSARWDSPVPQLREYLQAQRAIFTCFQSGTPLNFEGDHYQLTRLQPFFNPGPLEVPAPALFAGAVGPAMTRMAARHADGMITHPSHSAPAVLREHTLPLIEAGLARSGNTRSAFSLLVSPLVATGRDAAAVANAREWVRGLFGFLFSTPAYWQALALLGREGLGERLHALGRAGDWPATAALIDDELLEALSPCGDYDHVVADYRTRFAGIADRVTFPMPEDPADDARAAEVVAGIRALD